MKINTDARLGNSRKILIVDDHPLVRRGLSASLAQSVDWQVSGEASGVQDALQAIRNEPPDLVLSDLELEDGSGLDLIAILKEEYPDLPVVILSMHTEDVYAERVIRAGGKGYVMKDADPDKMMDSIRAALSGEVVLSNRMKDKILLGLSGKNRNTEAKLEDLSDRELQIFRMAGEGFPTRKMSEKLCLSSKTVEAHLAHIRRKLALDSGMELRRLAFSTFAQKSQKTSLIPCPINRYPRGISV